VGWRDIGDGAVLPCCFISLLLFMLVVYYIFVIIYRIQVHKSQKKQVWEAQIGQKCRYLQVDQKIQTSQKSNVLNVMIPSTFDNDYNFMMHCEDKHTLITTN